MEKIERLRNLDIGVNFDDVIAPWLNLIKEFFQDQVEVFYRYLFF